MSSSSSYHMTHRGFEGLCDIRPGLREAGRGKTQYYRKSQHRPVEFDEDGEVVQRARKTKPETENSACCPICKKTRVGGQGHEDGYHQAHALLSSSMYHTMLGVDSVSAILEDDPDTPPRILIHSCVILNRSKSAPCIEVIKLTVYTCKP